MELFKRAKKNAGQDAAQPETDARESAAADDDYMEGLRLFYLKRYDEAADTLRLAAELGSAKAQHFLAMMYENGNGIERDLAKAAYWYGKTAEQGDREAQLTYAMLCALGKGVEPDLAAACHWATLSQRQGSAKAGQTLRILRAQTAEAAMEELKAAMEAHQAEDHAGVAGHLRRAAELGSVEAQYALAQLLETGNGVERDGDEAAFWYASAAAEGHEKARAHLAEADAPQE